MEIAEPSEMQIPLAFAFSSALIAYEYERNERMEVTKSSSRKSRPQIRDAEDGGRLDKRLPQGHRVAEGQEEGEEEQEPGRRRVDVEGAGRPGQVLGGPDRAESPAPRQRAQLLGSRVLPLLNAIYGRSAAATRHERSQMCLHDSNGKCFCPGRFISININGSSGNRTMGIKKNLEKRSRKRMSAWNVS
jgi:hypothetical protein